MKQEITQFYDLGGTFRSRKPTETLAWVKPKLEKLGITRVANVTGLDQIGLFVTTCMRPNSKHLSVSQGKGLTLELAEISAIMESIEGYHIENPPAAQLHGSFNDLKEDYALISPERFARTQFNRRDLNHYPLDWVQAHNLMDGQSYYIPQLFTCIDTTRERPEYGFLKVSSNGLSAGNTKDEAICHALYEVIERDSHAKWQRLEEGLHQKTQVAMETVDSEINGELLEKFKEAGIIVKAWEITSESGVPAFHCAIYDENPLRNLGLFTGTGAHLSKDVALSRALTEAAQSRLTLISGQRDDIFPSYYQHMRTTRFDPNHIASVGERHYKACAAPLIEHDFSKNIADMLKRLKACGYDSVLLMDYTRPEVDVPVVQVFVPGFHFNNTRL